MADLENLLLEAAGRTGGGGGKRKGPPTSTSRRRQEGSYSEGGSDSREEFDSDEGGGYRGGKNRGKKPSGSQVPLKKRHEVEEEGEGGEEDDDEEEEYNVSGGEDGDGSGRDNDEDDRNDDDDDDDDESDVGDDLYKDEEDRRKLAQMSELEREMILSERADKKGDRNLTEKIRSKRRGGGGGGGGVNDKPGKRSGRDTTPPLPSSSSSRSIRTSSRSVDRSAAKDDALNELRAKRMKQHQDPETHGKSKDSSRGGGVSLTPIKRKGFTAANVSSDSDSESDSRSRSDDEMGDGGLGDSDDDRGRRGLTFEDIRDITIRRSKLAKWLMEPWFEELIVGCFVRVGIGRSKSGPVYRLCQVRNVDAADPDRPYRLENKMTFKYLNVTWGSESSAARWQMAMVSDSGPTEDEYRQWLREVEHTGGRMPCKQDVLEKKEMIKKSNSFVYSAATVKQMLQEKKSASTRPLNIAAEKDRLRRELEVAQSKHDEAEAGRIKTRIQELEASRQNHEKDSKAMKLAEMNRKNRVENFRIASEVKPVNTGLKAGEAGYDPFSRRWTRSTNYYVSKPAAGTNGQANDTAAGAESNGGVTAAAEAGVAATAAALEAAADAGKLVDTSAPVDQGTESNMLHDFDLPISLAALQKFGAAAGVHNGFMARKSRIEATVGCRFPENDGRRHTLTLSVSDYKRRRGLL